MLKLKLSSAKSVFMQIGCNFFKIKDLLQIFGLSRSFENSVLRSVENQVLIIVGKATEQRAASLFSTSAKICVGKHLVTYILFVNISR